MTGPAPSPCDMLGQRLDTIDATRRKADTRTPGNADEAKALEDYKKELDAERAATQDELTARERYKASTEESAKDPKPSPPSGPAYAAWAARERRRQAERKTLQEQISAARKRKSKLFPAQPVAGPVLACGRTADAAKDPVKPLNRIVAVEILDGTRQDESHDKIVTGRGVQWVNLEEYRGRRDIDNSALPAFLRKIGAENVTSFDRLGRKVRVRVRFLLAQAEDYEVRFVIKKRTNQYRPGEKSSSYGYTASPTDAADAPVWTATHRTDDRGIGVCEDFLLKAGGGDEWSFEARDHYGNTVKSAGWLIAFRGFFLTTLKMDDAKVVVPPHTDLKTEFRRNFIEIESVNLQTHGSTAKLTYNPVINSGDAQPAVAAKARTSSGNAWAAGTQAPTGYADQPALPAIAEFDEDNVIRAEALRVYNGLKTADGTPIGDLKPYLVASIHVDMCSTDPKPRILNVPMRTASADAKISVGFNSYLWDVRDTAHPWFVSGEYLYLDGREKKRGALAATDVTAVGSAANGWKQISVQLPAGLAGKKAALRLWLRFPNSSLNGFSRGSQGSWSMIALVSRNTYVARDPAGLQGTLIHELGHKINMTSGPTPAAAAGASAAEQKARGDAVSKFRGLDKIAEHYSLAGNHCHHGVVPARLAGGTLKYSGLRGQCVMYGEGWSGRPRQFCGPCTVNVTKIDLSEGWKDWR